MPVSSVTNRVAYQADGTSAVFPFQYPIFSQSDLGVFVFNSTASLVAMIAPKVLNTDYTISGTADSQGVYRAGANVIFNSSPNAQSIVVVFRSSVVTNGFVVPQNGTIPSTGLNNELDYLTLIDQRLQDQTTRSVRFPDGGHFPTFDPTLPPDIAKHPGWGVLINSSATGFIATPVGSTLFTGILPIQYGGTGTNSAFVRGALVFAGSGGIYASSPGMIWDEVNGVITLGSSFVNAAMVMAGPIQSQGLNVMAGSAILPVLSGPLRSVAGLVTVGSTAASEINGSFSVSQGGTGTSTSYIQYGVIYASSATQMGTVPSAAAGKALVSNGSSAPSFQDVVPTNNVITVSAAYNATTSDHHIIANSSLYIINLYGGVAGRRIRIERGSETLGNPITIAGSNANILVGGITSGSTTIDTLAEALSLTFDGTQWRGDRFIPPSSTAFAPPIFLGVGSSTALDLTWSRVGKGIAITGRFSCGVVSASDARLGLPSGLLTDVVTRSLVVGGWTRNQLSASFKSGTFIQSSLCAFLTFGIDDNQSSGGPFDPLAGNTIFTNSQAVAVRAIFCPISGWKA